MILSLRFFYLYRISYMYSAVMGFIFTFVIGYVVSYVVRLLKKQGKERIYTDETKTIMNPDLFMPPIAKNIRKRNLKFEETLKQKEIDEKY